MNYVAILAGGKGTRMGYTQSPKQFLIIGNKPIFIHTIEQFLINNQVDKILVCCPSEHVGYTHDMLIKYAGKAQIDNDKIHVVTGGKTRNDTIMNACEYIDNKFGIEEKDIIITHDAVRPFINQRIITENIEKAIQVGAVDTVIEAVDTIVESEDGMVISNIPIRSHMYQGQTPQTFNIKELLGMYESLTTEEKAILTDACKAFVIKNKEVAVVRGESYNIKITTQYDLKLADYIVETGVQND